MNIFRALRELVKASLAATDGTGFNSRLANRAAEYGIEPFEIDFGAGSRSFAESPIAASVRADGRDLGHLATFPALALYCSGAVNERLVRPATFAGRVTVNVDVRLRMAVRDGSAFGIEGGNTESLADAVADSVTECVTAVTGSGISFQGEYRIARSPLLHLPDGYEQVVRLEFDFKVVTT